MKANGLKYLWCVWGMLMIGSCSPDSYSYHDNSKIDVSLIDSVSLLPNHVMVLADGHACLDLYPRLFTKTGDCIPDSRVTEDLLEYVSPSGVALTRYFSTSDASLIGKTLTVQVKIKGTGVISEPVSFKVVAPLDSKYTSEIRIPVVFHIVQTAKEVESYGGQYGADMIALHVEKLNNLFGGIVSENPVGVNTCIRFELAQYDYKGKKMAEPGIDRFTPESIDNTGNYAEFLERSHLVWPADKYMNVWLISDLQSEVKDFGRNITDDCMPCYVYPGTPEGGRLEGIDWIEYAEGVTFTPKEVGILYKLQEIDNQSRDFLWNDGQDYSPINDLVFYVGRYLGLFPTYSYGDDPISDYCEDTQDYVGDGYGYNNTWYKTVGSCYFCAENIADDPTGVHVSVSKNQCERMRWVLENCPQRAAWKSDWAFTGK